MPGTRPPSTSKTTKQDGARSGNQQQGFSSWSARTAEWSRSTPSLSTNLSVSASATTSASVSVSSAPADRAGAQQLQPRSSPRASKSSRASKAASIATSGRAAAPPPPPPMVHFSSFDDFATAGLGFVGFGAEEEDEAPSPAFSQTSVPSGGSTGAQKRSKSSGELKQASSYLPRTAAAFHRQSSVNRVIPNMAVLEFHDWAQSDSDGWHKLHKMFLKEVESPAGGYNRQYGCGGRGLAKAPWIRLLMSNGFKSEQMAASVFEEIAKEIPAAESKGKLSEGVDEEITIQLAQLTRFEQKCICVAASLGAEHSQSSTSRFIKILKQNRGTTLRAWRLDLDKRGNGRVAFPDFCTICRELGFGPQGKLVWYNLRQDRVTPLEVHELDPTEADNLEDFASILWETFGFDLAKAWAFLDSNNQNFLTLEEFRTGVRSLGFEGDSKLLYRGLDSSGLGRLKRLDFEYIRKVSRIAHRQLGANALGDAAVQELITWVQRELGGTQNLLVKLGIFEGEESVTIADFVGRLTALGFAGDALRAGSVLARSEGGTSITGDAITTALSGGRPRPSITSSSGGRASILSSPSRSTPAGGNTLVAPPTPGPGGWCDSISNTSDANSQVCKYTRKYFTPPPRLDSNRMAPQNSELASFGSTASPASLTSQRALSGRPAWNDDTSDVRQQTNQSLSSHSRSYFSNFDEKPIREERRRMLVERRRKHMHEQGIAAF